jgi:protein-S-isoprenylcysteine O-methyltransferase Ste14
VQPHVSLVFQPPEAYVFWAVFAWAFVPELILIRKSRRATPSAQDAGTLRLIMVGQRLGVVAAFAASSLPWFVLPWQRLFFILGTCGVLAASILRRICFHTLGRHFTGAVVVSADQPVVDRGPYRWVRHPSYTAGFLLFLGIGMALGSWLSVIIFFTASTLVYARRVKVEEQALLETIGEPYRLYMKRTKRFIPFLI